MFKLQPRERMNLWRNFRRDLDSLPLAKAIESTDNFWQKCPFSPFYLDLDNPVSWPTPWDLITENRYCDIAKVLGIVYTLHLTSHGPLLNPEIRAYYNAQSRHLYHIAYLCRGKYVLNLIEGEIVNKEHITQQLKLKHRYTAVDLKLEQY